MLDTQNAIARLLHDVAPFVVRQAHKEGASTPVPRLTVWTSTHDTPPTQAIFEPMFYVVLRGTKVLVMGANRFELRTGACAASSFGLPYTHELTGGTPDLPMSG